MNRTPAHHSDEPSSVPPAARREFLLSIGGVAGCAVVLQACGNLPGEVTTLHKDVAGGTDLAAAEEVAGDVAADTGVDAAADVPAQVDGGTVDGGGGGTDAGPVDVPPAETACDPGKPLLSFVETGAFAPLASPGGHVAAMAGTQPIILVRVSATEMIALGGVCTHSACGLGPDDAGAWDAKSKTVKCLCHGSAFSTTGAVTKGPANKPLKAFKVAKVCEKWQVTA